MRMLGADKFRWVNDLHISLRETVRDDDVSAVMLGTHENFLWTGAIYVIFLTSLETLSARPGDGVAHRPDKTNAD